MEHIKFTLTTEEIKEHILPRFNIFDAKIFEIKVKNTDKQRAVYKVVCNNIEYCLKKVYYSKEDLLFIYSVVEWLYRNGINTARFLKSTDNKRFIEYNNMLFIMTPWISGFKYDYDAPNSIPKAASLLGKFHKTTKGFFPIDGSSVRCSYSNLYSSLYKHTSQIKYISKKARSINDEFSNIFLDNYVDYISIANKCLTLSSNINMDNLSRSICHGDYVSKNIIVQDSGELALIDFDKCSYNFCADDIGYYLRRLLKRENTKWDITLTEDFLKEYNKYNLLNADDIAYILSYILFPQKFWRLSRDYYNNFNKANKKSFCTLLKKSTKQLSLQLQFMNLIIADFNL